MHGHMDLTPFPRMCGWVGHVTGNRPVGCAQKAAWLPAAPGGGRPTAVPCPLLLGGALLSHPMRELWRRCARGGERAWRGPVGCPAPAGPGLGHIPTAQQPLMFWFPVLHRWTKSTQKHVGLIFYLHALYKNTLFLLTILRLWLKSRFLWLL